MSDPSVTPEQPVEPEPEQPDEPEPDEPVDPAPEPGRERVIVEGERLDDEKVEPDE